MRHAPRRREGTARACGTCAGLRTRRVLNSATAARSSAAGAGLGRPQAVGRTGPPLALSNKVLLGHPHIHCCILYGCFRADMAVSSGRRGDRMPYKSKPVYSLAHYGKILQGEKKKQPWVRVWIKMSS